MHKLEAETQICPHCGFDADSYEYDPTTLAPGTTLHDNKYVLGRMLGRGGFGITYVGLETTLNLKVAIKEYYPQSMVYRTAGSASLSWQSGDRDRGRKSFVREAMKMAKIAAIPHVAQVRDVFYQNNTAYIVMNYIEGETLSDLVKNDGVMQEEECLTLLEPVMKSLTEAHKMGMIHRDISPDNLIRDNWGEVWLLDLGAAKEMDDTSGDDQNAQSTHLVVRHGFSPPEQYDGQGKIGPWTDVYSMCATIWYCLTGQMPPDAVSRYSQTRGKDSLPIVTGLRPQVKRVLERGMSMRPEKRIASMDALLRELEQVIGQENKPKASLLDKIKDLPNTSTGRRRLIAMGAAAAALVAVVCLALILPNQLKEAHLSTTKLSNAVKGNTITEVVFTDSMKGLGKGAVDVSDVSNGKVKAYVDDTTLYVAGKGGVKAPEDCSWLFNGWKKLKTVSGTEYLDCSEVTTMSSMFADCMSLESLDLSSWDTSQVTSMSSMFSNCSSLKSLTVDNWNVSSVTDLSWTFNDCTSLEELNVSKWDTSSVASMDGTFSGCEALTKLELSDWNVSGTTDMSYMFYNCSALTELDLEKWDISSLVTADSMFGSCTSLKELNVFEWDWSSVKSDSLIFFRTKWENWSPTSGKVPLFPEGTLSQSKLSDWVQRDKVEEVVFERTLKNAPSGGKDLSEAGDGTVLAWMDGNVMHIAGKGGVQAPENCFELFSGKDAYNDASMRWSALKKVTGAENLDVSKTTSLDSCFYFCEKLESVDVSSWDISNVTDLSFMFTCCEKLSDLGETGVTNWDTSHVEDFGAIFASCKSLTELDLHNWDTKRAKNMRAMFLDCSSLRTLNVKGWDTSNVTDFSYCLCNCSSLETWIGISDWKVSNSADQTSMFEGTKLE